jgi:hypothetical protein
MGESFLNRDVGSRGTVEASRRSRTSRHLPSSPLTNPTVSRAPDCFGGSEAARGREPAALMSVTGRGANRLLLSLDVRSRLDELRGRAVGRATRHMVTSRPLLHARAESAAVLRPLAANRGSERLVAWTCSETGPSDRIRAGRVLSRGKSPRRVMPTTAPEAIIAIVEPPEDAPSSDVEVERPQMLPHPGRQWGGFCVLRHASHVITKYMPAGADAISPVGLRVAPTPRVGSLRRSYRRLSIGATREAWRPPAGHRQPNVGHCEVHDGWDIFRPPLSP